MPAGWKTLRDTAHDRLERYLSGRSRWSTLDDAVGAFMDRSGLKRRMKYTAIYGVWDRALREDAEHTRVVSVRGGSLEVMVDSAALLHKLEFQRLDLVRLLQAEVSKPYITRILFRLGAPNEERTEGRRDS